MYLYIILCSAMFRKRKKCFYGKVDSPASNTELARNLKHGGRRFSHWRIIIFIFKSFTFGLYSRDDDENYEWPLTRPACAHYPSFLSISIFIHLSVRLFTQRIFFRVLHYVVLLFPPLSRPLSFSVSFLSYIFLPFLPFSLSFHHIHGIFVPTCPSFVQN